MRVSSERCCEGGALGRAASQAMLESAPWLRYAGADQVGGAVQAAARGGGCGLRRALAHPASGEVAVLMLCVKLNLHVYGHHSRIYLISD